MLLTRKSTTVSAAQGRLARSVSGNLGKTIDRRTFLQRSGIALGAGAFFSGLLLYILKRRELKGIINSAVVVGLICYSGAVAVLAVDVVQPLRAWFTFWHPNVHSMLAGNGRDWDEDEMVAVQMQLTANSARMITAVDRVLNYVHQRTVQRLTLEAVRTAAETNTGVGGLRLDPRTTPPATSPT